MQTKKTKTTKIPSAHANKNYSSKRAVFYHIETYIYAMKALFQQWPHNELADL